MTTFVGSCAGCQENAERGRTLKLYESETALKVEEENAHMVEPQRGTRRRRRRATRRRHASSSARFAEMTPGMVLSHAMMEMTRSGHVATIHFTPEVVNAIQAAAPAPVP
jgi:hypothetical protein